MDIQTVAQFYSQLDKEHLDGLQAIYHDDVVFEDAAHRIEGVEHLLQYFTNLYHSVERCQFSIHEQHQTDASGFLTWSMYLQHPKLSRGKEIEVKGISHLKFADNKVIYHRDYFDLGEMLYEQLPLLGPLVRAIKQRLGQ